MPTFRLPTPKPLVDDTEGTATVSVEEFPLATVAARKPKKSSKEKLRLRTIDPALSQGKYEGVRVDKNEAFKGILDEDDNGMAELQNKSLSDLSEEEIKKYYKGAKEKMDSMFDLLMGEDDSEDELKADSFDDLVAKIEQKAAKKKAKRTEKDAKYLEHGSLQQQLQELQITTDSSVQALLAEKRSEAEKGRYAKNQMRIIGDLLNLRIRLQPVLVAANRFPPAPLLADFVEINQDPVDKATTNLWELLFSLQDLQVDLAQHHSDIPPAKRQRRDVQENWGQVSQHLTLTKPFIDATLNKWHQKARTVAGSKQAFKALDQNLVAQIDHALQDIERGIRRTQIVRSGAQQLGTTDETVQSQLPGAERYNPEIFDDCDFYSILLGDIIEQGTGDTTAQEEERRRLASNRRHLANGKRQTKGRRLNMDVHDKLVNFMAPVLTEVPPTSDSLFSGLFGAVPQAIVESDSD
eukprot:TRINITY_DN2943_c0_g1_i1.p1 TRINITY_DN2943_c0_g1~~TRINITY_DN2943_c0_g1_i1.p1  ORF type:complete len:466 (+),score=98.35 TRINITY_DN2943_c0_g1_i1:38-1435(+)